MFGPRLVTVNKPVTVFFGCFHNLSRLGTLARRRQQVLAPGAAMLCVSQGIPTLNRPDHRPASISSSSFPKLSKDNSTIGRALSGVISLNFHVTCAHVANMRSLPFTVLSLLFSCVQLLHARQPGTSTAVTITTSTSDATANAAESVLLASQSTSTAGAQAAVSLTHTTPIAAATTTASSNAQTSVVQATHTETGFVASASGSLGVDTAAGAAGSDTSSFNLSKGGLIAVVVIVVIVVVFGGEHATNVVEHSRHKLTNASRIDNSIHSRQATTMGCPCFDQASLAPSHWPPRRCQERFR